MLQIEDNPHFSKILATITCLIAIVESETNNIPHLIEMFNGMRVERKYLLLIVPALDTSLFQNKTINYNVGVHQRNTGDILFDIPYHSL